MSRRLLPVADPTFPRTANVILPPEHPVWALGSAEEAACMLADSGTGFRFASCCGWSDRCSAGCAPLSLTSRSMTSSAQTRPPRLRRAHRVPPPRRAARRSGLVAILSTRVLSLGAFPAPCYSPRQQLLLPKAERPPRDRRETAERPPRYTAPAAPGAGVRGHLHRLGAVSEPPRSRLAPAGGGCAGGRRHPRLPARHWAGSQLGALGRGHARRGARRR